MRVEDITDEWLDKMFVVPEYLEDEVEEKPIIKQSITRAIERSGIPKRYLNADKTSLDQSVLEWCDHLSDGLLLQGDVGRGKTHNACGIAIKLLKDEKIKSVRFVSFPNLLEKIKAGFNKRDCEDLEEQCISSRFLILDDIGKEKASEWSAGILFNILNERYANKLPTIITTQYSGNELLKKFSYDGDDKTGKAIISRLCGFKVVKLGGPDRRNHGL